MFVAHIYGQLQQQPLHIFAFPIPCCQSMNCRGVPKVMEARLAARTTTSAQTSMLTQLLKGSFKCVEEYLPTLSSHKEWDICLT
jgi:hypothetical protein